MVDPTGFEPALLLVNGRVLPITPRALESTGAEYNIKISLKGDFYVTSSV